MHFKYMKFTSVGCWGHSPVQVGALDCLGTSPTYRQHSWWPLRGGQQQPLPTLCQDPSFRGSLLPLALLGLCSHCWGPARHPWPSPYLRGSQTGGIPPIQPGSPPRIAELPSAPVSPALSKPPAALAAPRQSTWTWLALSRASTC